VILIGHIPCGLSNMIIPFPPSFHFSVCLNRIWSMWRWRQHVPLECLYQLWSYMVSKPRSSPFTMIYRWTCNGIHRNLNVYSAMWYLL
jgi:hypothetical protein